MPDHTEQLYNNSDGSSAILSIESIIDSNGSPCSACCSNRLVHVSPADIVILADALELSTGRLINDFLILSEAGAFLRHQLNGDCLFLKEKQCQVAATRPLSCKLFPLIKTSAPDQEASYEMIKSSVPLEEGPPRTVAQFLSEQRVQPVIEFTDRYADLFIALAEKIMGGHSEQETHSPGFTADISAYDTVQLMSVLLDADRLCEFHGSVVPGNTVEQKIDRHIEAIRAVLNGEIAIAELLQANNNYQPDELPDIRFDHYDAPYTDCIWPIMHKSFYSPVPTRVAPDGRAGLIVSLVKQLESTAHRSPENIRSHQFLQIEKLVKHFQSTSCWYRQRLEEIDYQIPANITADNFQQLPILTRGDFQAAGDALYSNNIPFDHGSLDRFTTSGSTGKPVTIRSTALSNAVHWATFIRNDQWHGRDFNKKFAYIQAFRDLEFGKYPQGEHFDSWNEAIESGPLVKLNVATSTLEQQLEWLQREQPAYLMSFPSCLEALARLCLRKSQSLPWLENISTIGEQLSPAQREVMQAAWGVPVCETYGCAEALYIAFQSPDSRQLLVQSESVYLEILDDAGKPCKAGQAGRVVVTDLHNFATPVIRYAVGDLAVWGMPEGNWGLPAIDHILGRSRNAIRLPNGEKAFALRWSEDMGRIAPVLQWQVIQTGLADMEVKMVVERRLSQHEEEAILAAFKRVLGDSFNLKALYVDEIPRSASGKYQEFRCEITD